MLGKVSGEKLTDADIAWLAQEHGWHPAVLEAISIVESQGDSTFADGRLKILNEHHWFYKLVKDPAQRAEAVRIGLARAKWISPKAGGYKDQPNSAARYSQLGQKIAINRKAAFESISMGRFQIMGFNYRKCGYSSAEEMFESFCQGEKAQLIAFRDFLLASGLKSAVARSDFRAVETSYNGGGLNGAYAAKMEVAANKLRAGKWRDYSPRTPTAPTPTTILSAPPVIEALIPEGLQEPLSQSTTLWASYGGIATTVFTAFTGLDWKVAVPLVVLAGLFGGWVIWNRTRLAGEVQVLLAAANGKTLPGANGNGA